MRGASALLRKPVCIGSTASAITIPPLSAAFSTSSGDGGGGGSGRGRGRGGFAPSQSPLPFNRPENPKSSDASADPAQSTAPVPGRGHGRGRPLPSSPFLPSFNSVAASKPAHSPDISGVGRGVGAGEVNQEESTNKPVFFRKDGGESGGPGDARGPVNPNLRKPIGEAPFPETMLGVMKGMGRGQSMRGPEAASQREEKEVEENRHIRRPRGGFQGRPDDASMAADSGDSGARARAPKLSVEEARVKAMSVLSRGDSGRGEAGGFGRGGGRGRGREEEFGGRGRGSRGANAGAPVDDIEKDAAVQRLGKELGPETMEKLKKVIEEAAENVVPTVADEVYLNAADYNFRLEFEPEYEMGEFDRNPDIDENLPHMSMEEFFEKVKPYLMVYGGIENEEQWKENIAWTMKKVPQMKKLVDFYSGPNKISAKKQIGELERVAKALPQNTPNSVKRFTDRAVLTLQSNPGWSFNHKCQFMDYLVAGVSQVYGKK